MAATAARSKAHNPKPLGRKAIKGAPTSAGPVDPNDPNVLARSCMLVVLSVSMWIGRKLDRKVTRDVAKRAGASETEAGQYNKALVPPGALSRVTATAAAIRTIHNRFTLPWLDGGFRVLTGKAYFPYLQEMRPALQAFQDAADDFAARYPRIIANGANTLGTMFDRADYPSASDIRERFDAATHFMTFPTADDFRVDGLKDEAEKIKASIGDLSNRLTDSARQECAERVLDVANRMVERLDVFKVAKDGSVSNPFRDSLVTNARDLVALLPLLNVANDPAIIRITSKLDELASVEPDELRANPDKRAKAKAEAQAIADRMKDYV